MWQPSTLDQACTQVTFLTQCSDTDLYKLSLCVHSGGQAFLQGKVVASQKVS